MEPQTDVLVDGSSYEWDEGERAVVLRYMVSGQVSRWAIVELIARRDADGILRWHDGRFLHQGSGISYREAVKMSAEFAEEIGGHVPVFEVPGKELVTTSATLVGQWRHLDFVNNRKNRIFKALKEDV